MPGDLKMAQNNILTARHKKLEQGNLSRQSPFFFFERLPLLDNPFF
jgi:hypothetical protein